MEERINQIINGFKETYNKISKIKKYVEIFNKYDKKLRKEFSRKEEYISEEDYNDNLAKINTINIIELEKIIEKHIEYFEKLEKFAIRILKGNED